MDEPGDNRTIRDSVAAEPPSAGAAGEAADRIGDIIGKFTVLGKLGEGGMGVVYVAYDAELDRRVAVKLLRPELSLRPKVREQLLNEAQMLAKLSHPNVLQVYDVGIHRQQIYLALEYVEGESLREWQARHRDWRALVAVYRACGEALMAAHTTGLVHRDFKPENVLIGVDGRPRVLDFGLATLASPASGARSGETLVSSQERGRRVGTPAYMSPEQHAGLETDARSDQFNYCAALYEALYGVRPFEGDSLQEIGQNVLHGAPVPARGKSPVWLRRVVLRGLALDPDARWPTMQALLDEIDRRTRSVPALWTVSMGLIALIAGVVIAFRPAEDPCTSGTQRALSILSIDRLGRIEAAFAASGLEDADEIWRTVRRDVEDQLLEWHGVYNVACTAHARSEVSDAVYYAQVACLDQRMLAFETALAALEKPGPELVRRARRGLAELQPSEPCGRRDQLRAVTPLPTNLAVASEVATLRGWLTRDDALRRMELTPPRTRDFPTILARAQATGHAPLIANVLAAMALEVTPNPAESERLLLQAIYLAEAAGDDPLVADIGLPLVHVMGYRNLRFDEAGRWAALVAAKLERTRAGARWREELEHNRGTIARRRGDDEAGRGHFEAAIQISRGESPLDLRRIGVNLRYLAAIDIKLGRLDRGEAHLAEAAAMLRASVGQEHRLYGLIRITRGHLLLARGEYAAAKRVFAELRDAWAASTGSGSSEVALALQNLANACVLLGEHEEALGYLDRGESILHDANGDASPSRAGMLILRALIERDRERPAAAETLLRRSLEIYTFAYRGEHPDIARTLLFLGEVALAQGAVAAAERYRGRADSALSALPGPQQLLRADLALLSAELAIAREDWQTARRWARSASSQYEGQSTEPWTRARTLFASARAEAGSGAAFATVYQLGSAARAELRPVNAGQSTLKRTISRWLAELPSPAEKSQAREPSPPEATP